MISAIAMSPATTSTSNATTATSNGSAAARVTLVDGEIPDITRAVAHSRLAMGVLPVNAQFW